MAQRNPDGSRRPKRFLDLEALYSILPWKGKKEQAPRAQQFRHVRVSTGGPQRLTPLPDGGTGWNAGDIDFRPDGAIFIRNPYLADAIEQHLKDSYDQLPGGTSTNPDTNDMFLLKIVRDEGWSGTETNIVCT